MDAFFCIFIEVYLSKISLSKIFLSKIDSLCFPSNGGNYSFTIGKNLRLFIFGINNHLAF